MTRRVKEVCQISVIVFLLYVLSIDDEITVDDDYISNLAKYHASFDIEELIDAKPEDKPIPKRKPIEPEVKEYKLSPLTKVFLMRLKNQTNVPMTLYTKYLINPKTICPFNTSVDYLIIVNSATNNFDRRSVIRNTFGQNNLFGHLTHRVAFLMGTSPDQDISRAIQEEAKEHKDIVQGDFHDSYRNLTLKGIMGLRWINDSCPNTKLIVKIDDDVFLNVFRLVSHWIPKYSNKYKKLGCDLLSKGKSHIYRRYDDKWSVDKDLFKGFDHFPFSHCRGYYVVMTPDLVQPMLDVAKITPFFWIDDVYLYGLLPLTIRDISMARQWRDFTDSDSFATNCVMKGPDCQYVVFDGKNVFDEKMTYYMWSNLTSDLTPEQRETYSWKS